MLKRVGLVLAVAVLLVPGYQEAAKYKFINKAGRPVGIRAMISDGTFQRLRIEPNGMAYDGTVSALVIGPEGMAQAYRGAQLTNEQGWYNLGGRKSAQFFISYQKRASRASSGMAVFQDISSRELPVKAAANAPNKNPLSKDFEGEVTVDVGQDERVF